MLHHDHISLVVQDVFEAANKLRDETGIGYYDGGWNSGGMGNRIFPLGNGVYIQMSGIVNPYLLKDPKNKGLQLTYKLAEDGERFRGFALGVDSEDELAKYAAMHGGTVTHPNPAGGRILCDGRHLTAMGFTNMEQAWNKGLPIFNYFPDRSMHPSGQPLIPYPGLRKPLGIAWMEVGGTQKDMEDWIGQPASTLNLRFNGKAPGLYAIAVKTETTEVEIRRKAINET